MKIIVLGAGLVGAPMAIDLAKDGEFEVSVADKSNKSFDRLKPYNIKTLQEDLSDVNRDAEAD